MRFRLAAPRAALILVCWAAACGALGAALALRRGAAWGVALHSDSIDYIAAARNLAEGAGLVNYVGDPLVYWPPLYPLLLALPAVAGADPLRAAGPLNAALFGLTIFAAGVWLARRCESWFLAGWATLALAASPVLGRWAGWAMSETPFVLLSTLSLISLDAHLRKRRTATLVQAASLASLACLTRYAGFALVAAALPLLALQPGASARSRARDAALYAAIASAPAAWWSLSDITGRELHPVEGADLIVGVARWLAPGGGPEASAAAGVLLSAVALWLGLRFASWARGRGGERDASALAVGGFAFASLALWLAAVSQGAAFEWERYLVPALLPLLLTIALALDRLLGRALRDGLPWARAAAVALLLWLSWLPQWHADAIREADAGASHRYAGPRWAGSALLAHMREQPCSCLTLTSNPPAYYIHGGPGEFRGLPRSLDALREQIRLAPVGSRVAWRHGGFVYAQYGLSELYAHPDLAVVAEFSDGVLFRIESGGGEDRLAALEAAYASIAAGEPAVRAPFDVYAEGRTLHWLREPCAPSDTNPRFVLHVVPADPGDLPSERRSSGFDNLDFWFGEHGVRFGERCHVQVVLPDYAIERVRVGQWLPAEERNLWQREFAFGDVGERGGGEDRLAALEAAYASIAAGEPAVRAPFDVYAEGRTLHWLREPCAPSDTNPRFVLHVVPADPGDLPSERRSSGFDNLDFWFGEHGVRFGERCHVQVVLPDYAIERVRVGQWLPAEERNLWQQEFAFAE